jgi:DNA-binding CsgD family transcriptional regulator
MEGFIFANKNSCVGTLSDYLEKLDLLKKFSRYFKREARSIIGRMSSEKYNIYKARENKFLNLSENLPLSKNNHLEQQFLAEIWKLSPQEQKCLEMFKMGNSAQSTAAKLGLSQRTVEHYLDNVKIKLKCLSKWDLLNT